MDAFEMLKLLSNYSNTLEKWCFIFCFFISFINQTGTWYFDIDRQWGKKRVSFDLDPFSHIELNANRSYIDGKYKWKFRIWSRVSFGSEWSWSQRNAIQVIQSFQMNSARQMRMRIRMRVQFNLISTKRISVILQCFFFILLCSFYNAIETRKCMWRNLSTIELPALLLLLLFGCKICAEMHRFSIGTDTNKQTNRIAIFYFFAHSKFQCGKHYIDNLKREIPKHKWKYPRINAERIIVALCVCGCVYLFNGRTHDIRNSGHCK